MPFQIMECCVCLGTRICALIVAYINMVWFIILTAGCIWSLVDNIITVEDTIEENKKLAAAIDILFLGLTLLCVGLYLIFTIVLVIGLHEKIRGYISAYLIYNGIFILFSAIMCFTYIGLNMPLEDHITNLFSLLLSIFTLFIITRYYSKMEYIDFEGINDSPRDEGADQVQNDAEESATHSLLPS